MAREFDNCKRFDAFSPAMGCHTTNLVPLIHLHRLGQLQDDVDERSPYSVTLAALDVKDACLQVPQGKAYSESSWEVNNLQF